MNNTPFYPSKTIATFRPAWVQQTKEPENPARTCPFKHPLYNGEQPECFHDCALYDDQKTGCAVDQLQARHPERRLFAGLVRVPEPKEKP